MEERFNPPEERFSSLEERFHSLEERFPTLEERFHSLDEILSYALEEEEKAAQFYRGAAHRTEDPELKGVLLEMAEMELEHAAILKAKLDQHRASQFSSRGILVSFDEEF